MTILAFDCAVSGLGVVNLIAGFADLSVMFATRTRREDVTWEDGGGQSL